MSRGARIFYVVAALTSAGLIVLNLRPATPGAQAAYVVPQGAIVTRFPAGGGQALRHALVIEAATDVSFMRPFIAAYQRRRPDVAVTYIDSISTALLARARHACASEAPTADLYLSVSSDHLVLLANEGCALALPGDASAAPSDAQWRREVAAFTVEPAVFVYGTRRLRASEVPHSHAALIVWLRATPGNHGRIGTYDIEESGTGYNFAADDARQHATYGRLLEGFSRMGMRTYCCSNTMLDALDRGEIDFAYNVQMSYAYAARRAGRQIGVILPNDYQAVQTRSMMIPRGAHDPALAGDFASFLNSSAGRDLARRQLMEPGVSDARAAATAELLLDRAVVSPLLLALQDQARRARALNEWRQAMIAPPLTAPSPEKVPAEPVTSMLNR